VESPLIADRLLGRI